MGKLVCEHFDDDFYSAKSIQHGITSTIGRYYFHDHLSVCLFLCLFVILFVSTTKQILLVGIS